jgi:hypothetical protein
LVASKANCSHYYFKVLHPYKNKQVELLLYIGGKDFGPLKGRKFRVVEALSALYSG